MLKTISASLLSLSFLLTGVAFAAHHDVAQSGAMGSMPMTQMPAKEKAKEPGHKLTAQQEKMRMCNQQAKGKKGEERKAFMRSCLSNKK